MSFKHQITHHCQSKANIVCSSNIDWLSLMCQSRGHFSKRDIFADRLVFRNWSYRDPRNHMIAHKLAETFVHSDGRLADRSRRFEVDRSRQRAQQRLTCAIRHITTCRSEDSETDHFDYSAKQIKVRRYEIVNILSFQITSSLFLPRKMWCQSIIYYNIGE